MELRTDDFITFNEYIEILDDDYVTFSNGFIEELDGEHIVDIFRDILIDNKLFVTFDNDEKRKYEFRPKVLSNDIYNTPDLWFIILKLNNLTHPGEFEIKDGVYLMNPKNLSKLVGSLEEFKNKL